MTSLQGPYDHHPRDDVRRLSCAVPTAIADDLLNRMFPQHGFQDRFLATLINWFYLECQRAGVPKEFHKSNEQLAKQILAKLTASSHVHR